MSLKQAQSILSTVEKVLKSVTLRNQYEANNMYLTNMQRLAQARRCLNDFTGTYPQSIIQQIGNLQTKVKQKFTNFTVKPQHDAFALDFGYSSNEAKALNATTKEQVDGLRDGNLTSRDNINDEDDFALQLATSVLNKKCCNNKNASIKKKGKNTSNKNNGKKDNKDNAQSVKKSDSNNNSNNKNDDVKSDKQQSKTKRKASLRDNINTDQDKITVQQSVTFNKVEKINQQNVCNNANHDNQDAQQAKIIQKNQIDQQFSEKIVRQDVQVQFSAIPSAILAKGGRCTQLANSPLTAIYFTQPIVIQTDTDDVLCNCKIETFKCVWLALAWGCPVSKQQKEVGKLLGARSVELNVQKRGDKFKHTKSDLINVGDEQIIDTEKKVISTSNEDIKCINESSTESVADVYECNTYSQQLMSQQENVDILSQQLVAKYDATVQADLVHQRDRHFPRFISAQQAHRLRQIKQKGVWVILLCHGGCFAGGVYQNGRCIVHKAFQRYVIRKKQGGKQSNFGDSSTFHSAGSMIRSAQELKWKIDVRAVLLSWRGHINEADIILYAAPGPQNRAILTDFSQLPKLSTLPKDAADSPVSLLDKRVWGIPMTTHKPSFNELQRIYDSLTHINVTYYKHEK